MWLRENLTGTTHLGQFLFGSNYFNQFFFSLNFNFSWGKKLKYELLLNSFQKCSGDILKSKFAFRVVERGRLITKPPAIKTVYENRNTRTRPVVTKKKDKRTQSNFPSFVDFIDFFISDSQKSSKTNHVKSRIGLQRQRRVGIENHLSQSTAFRGRQIEKYSKSNQPVFPINPNKLDAKIINPGANSRNKSLVPNYQRFPSQPKTLTRRTLKTETYETRNPHPPPSSNDVISASPRPALKSRKHINAFSVPKVSQNHHSRNQELYRTSFPAADEFSLPHQATEEHQQEIIFVPQEMYETNFSSESTKTFSPSRPSYQETKPKQNIVRKRQGLPDQTVSVSSVSSRNNVLKTTKNNKPNILKRRYLNIRKEDRKIVKSQDKENPVFEFETKVSVSLDSNGYLMTIILISQIIIFGMVLYSRSLHDAKNNASRE